jgi:hypothetical protein
MTTTEDPDTGLDRSLVTDEDIYGYRLMDEDTYEYTWY